MAVPVHSFDMTQALSDLQELARLSVACRFDLCERMRVLENSGVVTLQIDGATEITAGSEVIRVIPPGQSVFRYKLSDALLADLADLRNRGEEAQH